MTSSDAETDYKPIIIIIILMRAGSFRRLTEKKRKLKEQKIRRHQDRLGDFAELKGFTFHLVANLCPH